MDTTIKLCECGCGSPTAIAPRNRPSAGMVKGQPMRFIRGHSSRVRTYDGPFGRRKYPERIQLTCLQCGKQFTRIPAEVAKARSRDVYCSRACYETAWGSPEDRFWSHVDTSGGPDACWEWVGSKTAKGYGRFYTPSGTVGAHRFSYELIHGPIATADFVCHDCDNPPCCNPSHLFLGSPTENMQDASRKGRLSSGERHFRRQHPERVYRGEQHGRSKLTEADVLAIRARYGAGNVSYSTLGQEFGVDKTAIAAIIKRKTWTHI